MDGVFFCRISADGPFVKALDPGDFSYCLMVRSGRLRLETDFPLTLTADLGPGDAVAVSGLAPHTFRSLDAQGSDPPGRFERRPMTEVVPGGEVDLVLGVAPNESLALASLMMGPIIVRAAEHPDLSRRLWAAVDMLEDEYFHASWIDRNLVIRRLAEIMLINMARRLFDGRKASDGEAAGPASRPVMLAIDAFFRAPERVWTLADLAKAGGMSRTRFAEEFRLATGHTPARIISRLRLTATARRLAAESLSVEAAAEDAGYSSAAAFVRAFQREFGETPARWRRRRRGDEPSALGAVPFSPVRALRRVRHETR
ncbi:MAG: helix-turn-helix transcriptional regulator [Caulobacterales bacterium]|nr:helix-turn-helix transcriptional regulator [Caulobacterales bacterium]